MSKWTMEQLLEAAEEREAESAIRQAELEAAYEATAAPDLLEAAKNVLDLVESEGRDTGLNDAFSDLRDAVAKGDDK